MHTHKGAASKKSVTVSIGYSTSTSRPLGEMLKYQIGEMQSPNGLTTSSSLKVVKNDGNIVATKLYSNVCYEYEIANEFQDIKHGFIWDNEKNLAVTQASRTHIDMPLISAGDMQSTPLLKNNPHSVQFSLHKYHTHTPGKSKPLTREQILNEMHPDLESLRIYTEQRHNSADKNERDKSTHYSEIQTKVKPHQQQRITRVVFNSKEGGSRYPFNYLFQDQNKKQSYYPTAEDYHHCMVFQAAMTQYEFYKNNINGDNQIVPMFKRIYDNNTDTVELKEFDANEILKTLNYLKDNKTSSFVQHITRSSHQNNNLQQDFLTDLEKLPELINFCNLQQQQLKQTQQQQIQQQQLQQQNRLQQKALILNLISQLNADTKNNNFYIRFQDQKQASAFADALFEHGVGGQGAGGKKFIINNNEIRITPDNLRKLVESKVIDTNELSRLLSALPVPQQQLQSQPQQIQQQQLQQQQRLEQKILIVNLIRHLNADAKHNNFYIRFQDQKQASAFADALFEHGVGGQGAGGKKFIINNNEIRITTDNLRKLVESKVIDTNELSRLLSALPAQQQQLQQPQQLQPQQLQQQPQFDIQKINYIQNLHKTQKFNTDYVYQIVFGTNDEAMKFYNKNQSTITKLNLDKTGKMLILHPNDFQQIAGQEPWLNKYLPSQQSTQQQQFQQPQQSQIQQQQQHNIEGLVDVSLIKNKNQMMNFHEPSEVYQMKFASNTNAQKFCEGNELPKKIHNGKSGCYLIVYPGDFNNKIKAKYPMLDTLLNNKAPTFTGSNML